MGRSEVRIVSDQPCAFLTNDSQSVILLSSYSGTAVPVCLVSSTAVHTREESREESRYLLDD